MLETKNLLHKHLKEIVRVRDPFIETGNHFYVKEYIRQELSQFGTVETHQFSMLDDTYENLILNIEPDSINSKNAPLLIGAHYDTVPGSPGADDNGTGVAVLLELARFFAKNKTKFPIRLVAFDLEEYGLVGSTAYAQFLKQKKEKLRLMISLEMLGYCNHEQNSQQYPLEIFKSIYPSQGNFIALIGNLMATADLIKISHNMEKLHLPCKWIPIPFQGRILPATRRSDHAPFWDSQYNAIMVTDTANLRNPNYHKPTDTIETINLDFVTLVCQGLINAIQNITFLL